MGQSHSTEISTVLDRRKFLKFSLLSGAIVGVASIATIPTVRALDLAELIPKRRYTAQGAQSYAVFIDSADNNLVKARNGTTGTIEFSSADAAQVIQNAASSLKSGGQILITAGTYPISTSILGSGMTGIELYGEGNSTVLRLANGVNDRVINLKSVKDWHIHDLQVDGNKANQAGSSQFSHGIGVWNCTNVVIERNYVHDCRTYGIQLSDNWNCKVLNNYIKDSSANGIGIGNEHGGQTTLVQGNVVDGVSDVGISTWHGIDVVIDNNSISNSNLNESPYAENSHNGIDLEQSSQRITASNNQISNFSHVGLTSGPNSGQMNADINLLSNQINNCNTAVYLGRTERVLVKGNTINTTAARGIVIDTLTSDLQIVGNQFYNIGGKSGIEGVVNGLLISGNTFKTVAGNAIVAWGHSNWTVQGNRIESTGRSGIYVGNGLTNSSDNWMIDNNSMLNCTDNGICIEGSYNTINSNRSSGCATGINITNARAAKNVVTSNNLVGNKIPMIDNGTETVKSNNTT